MMKLKITVLSVSFIAACIALGQNTFAPEDVIDLEFTIGDSSASHSERWLMNIAGGPTTLRAQSPDYGKMGTANFNQFRKGKAYSITVEHQGTHPQYIASTQDSSRETLFNGSSWYGSDAPDYDYKALVEVSTSVGYLVKDEAQPPLLGTSNGNETNEASGKTAYIAFPKPILSFTDYTEEQVAGDPGVLVMVNDNDSNEDGAIDSGSPYPEDPDYVEILLEVELSGAVTVDEGVMRLSANTNDLRVRDPDDSLAAQTFPIEWDMSTEDGDPFRSNGKKLLLEAMAPSDEYKDVTLTFEYVNNGSTSDEAELTLLKVDVAAHVPAELIDRDGELQKGVQIPSTDEDTAANLQFVINDDNDDQWAYNSTYPKDFDLADKFSRNEDDLVAVTFTFPKDIETGTLEISANVDGANLEARAYIITAGGMLKPTKELVTLNPATSIDLSSASNTDLLWELADEGEQTLYIEGLVAKDDLEIKLSFKVNDDELASESVHMQLLPSTERTLKVLAYSGMGYRAILHMNNADNVLREDHDGYNGSKDRVTPITFRQDGAASSSDVPSSWQSLDVSANDGKIDAVFRRLSQGPGHNIFICEYLYGVGGLARRGQEIMILGKPWSKSQTSGASKGVLAHEWLHAFADRGHVNTTDDIMWGTLPPPAEVDANDNGQLDGNETMVERGHGGNLSESQYSDFIN